ncbi:MAG TPA: alkaline phosphatase family protein, partial [Candidatus Tumulicola sp.]|nr:alkaline phosphatase family protein [Candidatus Tumulicola sp.]
MDPAPDGTRIVGGAAPDAIAMRRDGKLAYVALANVDRVAVVTLGRGAPRVARGLDLRLYPDAPYGAQPSAETLSKDGKRLYVALAGLNAIAVLDARSPTRYRYGLIPTGWYPTALALSPNGRFLYVAAAKGVDGWGVLTRVDLKHTSLVKDTMNTLRYNRTAKVAKADAIVPPLRSGKRSSAIDRIVYIAVGIDSYDAMLGDLTDASGSALGNGDAALAQYPRDVSPNLHALAQTYALADNFFAPDADVAVSRSIALDGDATLYQQLLARAVPPPGGGIGQDDPEDYPREGLLFNALARAGLSFRDYGGALQLSGYRSGLYRLDVPALAALAGNADTAYPGGDPRVDDAHRATEFVSDMQRYRDASQTPSFTYVWLPTRTTGDGVGDADRALGKIVDFLTHGPQWGSTAIFIVPEGVARGRDHVNPLRSYCVVVSPYAKRSYVGRAHLSVASVVKTEEEIFGLPPLSLSDLLATDMAGLFTAQPDPAPFTAIR